MDTLEKIFEKKRRDFPTLLKQVNGQRLVYLDSAATSLKPSVVIDRLKSFYEGEAANIHRGAHALADQATVSFEESRSKIARHLNARFTEEIVFTKGTTESINLVASSLGKSYLKAGDEVIISEMEHHSNIVPWHLLAETRGIKVKMVRVTPNGELDLRSFEELLSPKTKLVSISACSNVLGTINDVQMITRKAHEAGALVLIDGAQAIVHSSVDVQKMDCDFYAFSGHKVFAPFGIGVLYGKKELLDQMPPYQGGGSMIESVFEESSTYLKSPFRFEAGTPPISGAIALGTAIEYLQGVGVSNVQAWEARLLQKAETLLSKIEGLVLYGQPPEKCGIVSFNIKGIHYTDLAQILDQQGVALRAGHLCAQPLLRRLGAPGVLRASFSIYNTEEDVDKLILAIEKGRKLLL